MVDAHGRKGITSSFNSTSLTLRPVEIEGVNPQTFVLNARSKLFHRRRQRHVKESPISSRRIQITSPISSVQGSSKLSPLPTFSPLRLGNPFERRPPIGMSKNPVRHSRAPRNSFGPPVETLSRADISSSMGSARQPPAKASANNARSSTSGQERQNPQDHGRFGGRTSRRRIVAPGRQASASSFDGEPEKSLREGKNVHLADARWQTAPNSLDNHVPRHSRSRAERNTDPLEGTSIRCFDMASDS